MERNKTDSEEKALKKEIWNHAVEFHGHQCPGLAIGVMASIGALEQLNIKRAQDEELVCIVENDACGVDGVQAITGCTLGKGNLVFLDKGKQVYTFYNRKTGEGVRMYFTAESGDLEREDWMNFILSSSPKDIFQYSEPKEMVPEKARKFASIKCSVCGEKTAEHRMHIQEEKPVCKDCFSPYTRVERG